LVDTVAEMLSRAELTCQRLALPFVQSGARDRRFRVWTTLPD
jgi:hypothetical protein